MSINHLVSLNAKLDRVVEFRQPNQYPAQEPKKPSVLGRVAKAAAVGGAIYGGAGLARGANFYRKATGATSGDLARDSVKNPGLLLKMTKKGASLNNASMRGGLDTLQSKLRGFSKPTITASNRMLPAQGASLAANAVEQEGKIAEDILGKGKLRR